MSEHESRLRAMIEPGQQTWDLSPNDVAAIRWAVEEVERLRPVEPTMKVGERVRLTAFGMNSRLCLKAKNQRPKLIPEGTVTAICRDPLFIRVLVDGYKNTDTYHVSVWEPVTGAPVAQGEADD